MPEPRIPEEGTQSAKPYDGKELDVGEMARRQVWANHWKGVGKCWGQRGCHRTGCMLNKVETVDFSLKGLGSHHEQIYLFKGSSSSSCRMMDRSEEWEGTARSEERSSSPWCPWDVIATWTKGRGVSGVYLSLNVLLLWHFALSRFWLSTQCLTSCDNHPTMCWPRRWHAEILATPLSDHHSIADSVV